MLGRMRGFSREEHRSLEENGYVNVGQVLEPAELAEIRTEYDRLVTADKQTLGNDTDGRFPYRAMLNFRSDVLKRYISHSAFCGLAMDRLGPDLRFWWDQGINKQPGSGSHIDWHQDNGYGDGQVPEYLTFWLALDDSDLENGGLLVIPGSHLAGPREHRLEGVHWVIPDIDESPACALDARAGDLLIFSSLLIHKTVGNHTADRDRRAWVIQYIAADAQDEANGRVYEERPRVTLEGAILPELLVERPFSLTDKANRSA